LYQGLREHCGERGEHSGKKNSSAEIVLKQAEGCLLYSENRKEARLTETEYRRVKGSEVKKVKGGEIVQGRSGHCKDLGFRTEMGSR
jgi:hypothetical protein